MKKFLSITLIVLTCLSIFGCSSKNCITMSSGDEFCTIIDSDAKRFYTNGVLHKVDGPAVVYNDGSVEYWLDGVQYTKEEFEVITQVFEIMRKFNLN